MKNNSNKTPGEYFMNSTNHDTTAETATNDPNTRGNLTAVETPTDSPRGNGAQSKRLSRILTAAVVLVAVIAAGVYYFVFVGPFETTDDAFIDAHVSTVAPQVAGRVEQVLVNDNQFVNAGDALLQIDARDYKSKLTQAQANLTAAKSQLAQAKAQLAVDQAKAEQEHANLAAVAAQASYAQDNLKRLEAIGVSGVSQDQIDSAKTQARFTTANTEVAQNRIRAADAQAGLSEANVATADANVSQAEAALQQAELNLSYTKVIAPEAGRVTHRTVEIGAYVQPGLALLAIVPTNIWVVANFKETQLNTMRPGQPVTVKVDAYPHIKFSGHVDSIQSGSGSRFSLFPPENATGNYVKVVQRVPVKILLDDNSDPNVVLGPGMSVEPKVRVN
jgi:membrane fusion protein, multidrug efflux system